MGYDKKRKSAAVQKKADVNRRKNRPSRARDEPHRAQTVQRVLGNQAIQELVENEGPQATLEVDGPNDAYEREAARTAATRTDESHHQPQSGDEDTPDSTLDRGLRRTRNLRLTPANGRPLPDSVRERFEQQFDTGLSGVRIHDGQRAAELSRKLGANAFTHGTEIYFGAGRYTPETRTGQTLLAHELTHVLQQTGQGGATPVRSTTGPVIQRDTGRGTIETSRGTEEIEGLTITSSAESVQQRLRSQEEVIDEYIRNWTEDAIGDVRDGIQDAASSFEGWYQSRPRKPNTAGFVIDVASAVSGTIGAIFPPAGPASAIVSGLLAVAKDPLTKKLDPNAGPDEMAAQLKQNMIGLSSRVDQAFAGFHDRLKTESPQVWNDIGIALTQDPPLLSIAKEELHTRGGLPRGNQPYGTQFLSEMIYTYLDWEQRHELEESTFFVSSGSVEYAFATDQVQERFRRQAGKEAQSRLGGGGGK